MRKTVITAALAVFLASAASAAEVHLSDGSVLRGDVTQSGDVVKVVTVAGEMSVPKDKVVSIVENPAAATTAAPAGGGYSGTGSAYVDDVLRRRAKYGNSDGIPRSSLVRMDQLLFTLGQINYTGDAYLVKDTAGSTVLSASDLGSLDYGLAYSSSLNDFIAWELWGDYSNVSKDYTYNGSGNSSSVARFDIGIGPKVQKAIALGEPEQDLQLIPNVGITPFYANANGSTHGESFNHGNVGASLNFGVDFQFHGALLAVKARYLMSNDVDGGLHSSNTSAWVPQIGAGFAF